MKKHLFLLASLALGMAACTNDTLLPEDDSQVPNTPDQETSVSTLQHAKLSVINSSQDRVTLYPQTRDPQKGSLQLVASIDNPSKQVDKIPGFTQQGVQNDGVTPGRFLSATCVYYDPSTDTYYATYHMQGNNYNTDQDNETGGFVESFTIDENGEPVVDIIFSAADPSKLSFDFNHLYFDHIPNISETTITGMEMDYVGTYTVDDFRGTRMIAVGQKSEPSSKENGQPNTAAIIGQLNLEEETFDYEIIYTGDKILDPINGTTSLGKVNAGDANCVVRKYNHYYVATRRGIAVLKADQENIFKPELDVDNNYYFIKTPGSAKFLSQPTVTSELNILFLDKDHPKGDELTGEVTSPFTIAKLALDTRDGKDLPIYINTINNFDWANMASPNQIIETNLEYIKPVDGKNVMFITRNLICVALGKGGLYINNYPSYNSGKIIQFSDKIDGTGSRPVNGIFIEEKETINGLTSNNGFIYVANGACLTIIDAVTLETVAEYSAFKEGDASANYVYVKQEETQSNGQTNDRIVTVAYGQAGVKVFKFIPPTKL